MSEKDKTKMYSIYIILSDLDSYEKYADLIS